MRSTVEILTVHGAEDVKRWYDSLWLGDGEHGQAVPMHAGDKDYSKYMDGYALAHGAWIRSGEIAYQDGRADQADHMTIMANANRLLARLYPNG